MSFFEPCLNRSVWPHIRQSHQKWNSALVSASDNKVTGQIFVMMPPEAQFEPTSGNIRPQYHHPRLTMDGCYNGTSVLLNAAFTTPATKHFTRINKALPAFTVDEAEEGLLLFITTAGPFFAAQCKALVFQFRYLMSQIISSLSSLLPSAALSLPDLHNFGSNVSTISSNFCTLSSFPFTTRSCHSVQYLPLRVVGLNVFHLNPRRKSLRYR